MFNFFVHNLGVDILTVGNLDVDILMVGNSNVNIFMVGKSDVDIFSVSYSDVDTFTVGISSVNILMVGNSDVDILTVGNSDVGKVTRMQNRGVSSALAFISPQSVSIFFCCPKKSDNLLFPLTLPNLNFIRLILFFCLIASFGSLSTKIPGADSISLSRIVISKNYKCKGLSQLSNHRK
jgi:hypothetical protein